MRQNYLIRFIRDQAQLRKLLQVLHIQLQTFRIFSQLITVVQVPLLSLELQKVHPRNTTGRRIWWQSIMVSFFLNIMFCSYLMISDVNSRYIIFCRQCTNNRDSNTISRHYYYWISNTASCHSLVCTFYIFWYENTMLVS